MGSVKRFLGVLAVAAGIQAGIIVALTGVNIPANLLGTDTLQQKTPRAQYNSLTDTVDDATFHVTYKLASEELSSIRTDRTIDLYSYDGARKSVISAPTSYDSVQAEFTRNNMSVYCREDYTLDCSLSSGLADVRDMFLEQAEANMTLKRTGTKTVAGRKCAAFTTRVPKQALKSTFGQYGSTWTLHFCLDMKKGYVARLTPNITRTESQLGGEKTVSLFTIRATSYDTDVTAEDVAAPVPAVVNADCENRNQAEIVLLQETSRATITVNGGDNRSIPTATWEQQTVNLTGLEDGRNAVTVYTDTGAVSDTCYYTNYDSPYDDFDYHTGPDTSMTEPDPSLNRTITIHGTGEEAPYTLTVSGSIDKSTANNATLNDYDTVYGSTAEGRVISYSDSYAFNGTITSLDLSGNATMMVDGEPYTPE